MRHRRAPLLTSRDLAVLAIEREFGQHPDAQIIKFEHARRDLDLSPQAYNLIVAGLVNDPNAFEHDPETIGALRAVRDSHDRPARRGL